MSVDPARRKLQDEITDTFKDLAAQIRERHPHFVAPQETTPVSSIDRAAQAVVSQAVDAARRKAAVLGWFKPERLVKGADRPLKERVLSALVADCDVEPLRHGLSWRLRREPRREVLATLARHRDTTAQILRETETEANDPDSRLLRRVLQGQSVKLERARNDERTSMLRVAEWTDGIFKNAPNPAEVRGLLARDAIKESLAVLVDHFHGRETELATLRQFASFGAPGADGRLPILGVSGIGGIGKSALLARFADRLLAMPEAHRPAVVLIDFDRARFSSGDVIALTFELTRQIAAWFPAIAAPLRELRHSARLNLLSSGFSSPNQMATVVHEGVARSTSEMNHQLRPILARAGVGVPGGRPLVVVLDTFEVLQGAREEDADGSGYRGVHAVAELAQDLFSISGLNGLKVVVAGRAPIQEDPGFGPRLTEPELRLTGLDPPSSHALLRDEGLQKGEARLVVEAVGDSADRTCNPLILRLAARLVKARTVKAESLKGEAGSGRKALDQELVQGMLYRRILAHIGDRERDKALAALAHPGLVLRRVTPDLIEHVLIPLTDLKKQGPINSRELFERLRREVWLVQQTSDPDTVMHRTDLRRTMLRLIDAEMQSEARRIHRAAIQYYRAGRDTKLGTEPAAAEAFYHRLMLMNPAEAARIDPVEVRRFESALYPTLDDLPPHVLAVVKSLLDRPLTDKEGMALPEPRRTEFVLRQGERHVFNDEPYRALKLLEATPNLHPLWELRALCVTAGWPVAKERGLLRPPDAARRAEAMTSDLHERVNLASFSAFCLGDSKTAYECAAPLLSWFDDKPDWSIFPARLLEHLARGTSYRTVAARDGGSTARQGQGIPWSRLSEEQLGTTSMALEATRHAVLGMREESWERRMVISGEGIPTSLSLLAQLAYSGLPAEVTWRLRAVEKHLKALPKSVPSGQILGTIARGFPKAVIVDPSRWRELKFLWPLVCPNPEFRGPVKFALLEAFTTEKELALIAEWAWSLVDLHPQDLRPDVFGKTASRPGKAAPEIATLVLYLDRSTVLGRFLRAVRQEKPSAAKLALVSDAFERWERAFQPGPGPIPSGPR